MKDAGSYKLVSFTVYYTAGYWEYKHFQSLSSIVNVSYSAVLGGGLVPINIHVKHPRQSVHTFSIFIFNRKSVKQNTSGLKKTIEVE